MPKVLINEVDQSRYIAPGNNAPMVVLVPGTASFGPTFTDSNPLVSTFVGQNDLSAFYNLYGLMPATLSPKNRDVTLIGDTSFDYVTNLLNSGATVKFYRLNTGSFAKSTEIGTTNPVNISAKYTGKLGNYFIVTYHRVPTDVTNEYDLVFDVYRTSNANADSHVLTPAELDKSNKYNRLESYRVSDNQLSIYYDNIEKFEYIQMNANLITKILSATEDNNVVGYTLSGAYDFVSSAAPTTESDEATALTDVVTKLTDSFVEFVDKYLFDFDFITSGGFVNAANSAYSTIEAIHAKMISLAESRGDAIALLDTPQDMPAQSTAGITGVIDYAGKINTSFASIYAPWCSSVSVATGRTVMMPPSYNFIRAVLKGMNDSTVESQLWYVPAGVTRASAPFIVNSKYEIGSVILDAFQNNNNQRVNPIMRVRNYGYCVYGNATCLRAIPGSGNSALESMNVRLIANVIKKAIFAVCCGLSFEYNDSILWSKFYSRMDVVLTYMKRHFGLYDYKIIMDNTTVTAADMNNRRVPGKVKISPELAGEYFDIDFEISPAGVSFSEEDNI